MPSDRLLSRRAFVASGLTASIAACMHQRGAGPRGRLLYVGTFTDDGISKGIYRLRVDDHSAALRELDVIDAGTNPAFLALHPTTRVLYASNEVNAYEGRPSGSVTALVEDDDRWTVRGRGASRGPGPCYVSLDRTHRFALVANYAGGSVAVLPLHADGGVGEATAFDQHEGTGPDRTRQEAPHAHCILADPTNRFVLATDLGVDRIYVYRFDERRGTLAPAATPHIATAPGAGPRHLAFHPNGHLLFVVHELDLTLAAHRWDASTGTLTPLGAVPILPGLRRGDHTAADLHVAPSGRFLYTTVRGENVLAVFAIDAANGALTPVQHVSTEGNWPRNFALDPSGRSLIVANQRSSSLVGFHVDPATGRVTLSGQRAEVPSPVCVVFA